MAPPTFTLPPPYITTDSPTAYYFILLHLPKSPIRKWRVLPAPAPARPTASRLDRSSHGKGWNEPQQELLLQTKHTPTPPRTSKLIPAYLVSGSCPA
jgi:hypothetical protein